MFKNTSAFSSFSVDDMAKAKQFYGQTLGLETSDEYGMLHLLLAEGGKVMVYPKDNHTPATFTVLNFVVDDVEATVDKLTEQGVDFEHYDGDIKTNEKGIADDSRGPKIAWFKDPAGNIIAVLEKQKESTD